MNILIAPKEDSYFYFRPDSTLIRSLDEYYLPDFVEQIEFTPILYIKTLKPGKAVAKRFVTRYLDSFGFGSLLYPTLSNELNDNNAHQDFVSNSLDYTTIIPLDKFKIECLGELDNTGVLADKFVRPTFKINDTEISKDLIIPSLDNILERIANISEYYSFKIGDFICFPLTNKLKLKLGDIITLSIENKTLTRVLIK